MTNEAPAPTVSDVVGVLEQMYDPAWAKDWDAVGLVCGDPQAPVKRILLAVDPAPSVIEEALAWRADLILAHHPLLFKGVHSVAATTPKGRTVHQLVKSGCALYTAHTNADVAVPGVSDALARILGLTDLVPLSPDAPDPVDKLVTFVPADAVEAVIDALAAAGAGHLGDYERCAWTSAGTGTFVAGKASTPTIGAAGERSDVAEHRVEMTMPRPRRAAVLAALKTAHPYEEVPVDLYELAAWSGPRGIGRVGRIAPTTLREFAMLVAEALPSTMQGIRVAGEPTAMISRVAVCGGSGDSLLDAVKDSGVDVYVTADLRHHPASEFREHGDDMPPFLIDVAHWASEWPWLNGVANRLEGALDSAGTPVEVHVSTRCTDPWTMRVPSPAGVTR